MRFENYDYEGFGVERGGYHTPLTEGLTPVEGGYIPTVDNVEDAHDAPSWVNGLSDWAREVVEAMANTEIVKDATEESLGDDVHHPAHYNQGKIEVWDFIYDQGLGYAEGNAVKYISRSGKKAGNSKVKDLRKAVAFLEREIRFEETGE